MKVNSILYSVFILFVLLACLFISSCHQEHQHEYGPWKVVAQPSCTSEGRRVKICGECQKSISQVIPRLEHEFEESVCQPTCTHGGYTEYSCDCGYSYRADFLPPIDHSFTEKAIPPTCTHGGYTEYSCDCGYSYRRYTLPPLGHSVTETVTPPTCTEKGFTEYFCKVCGYKYKGNFLDAKGHDFTETVTPPTCTEKGFTEYSCKVCGYNYKGNFLDAKGHSFTDIRHFPTVLSQGYTEHVCDCSYRYTEHHVSYEDILKNAYCDNTEVLAKGVDISKYNHSQDSNGNYLPLDWAAIKEKGNDFVILKAGSTKTPLEPTFEMDYADAKKAGLEVGAYFYTYAKTVEDIKKDAETFISALNGKQFEYPVYLDIEDSSLEGLGKETLLEMCQAFIALLQENGYYAGIYCNRNWLTYILGKDEICSKYEVWYARYYQTESHVWNEEKDGKQLGMWQYTDSGIIEGFDGNFDFNYSYKNYKEIMLKWGLNGYDSI